MDWGFSETRCAATPKHFFQFIMSSWSIVSTVNEESEVLSIFVQHHLAIGCSEIHLYFDNPADPAKSLFLGDSRVKISDGSQIPDSHERKQSLNATDAYQRCRSEWLIHIDADEMVFCETGVGAALAALSPDVRQLNLLPWEAVFPDARSASQPFFSVHFRSALKSSGQPQILQNQYYPEAGPAMRSGLTGHLVGKSFIRKTNAAVRARIHFWKSAVEGEEIPVHQAGTGIRLLHFDAISFPQWKRKLERRICGDVVMKAMGVHRLTQLEAFKSAYQQAGEGALEGLFNQLYTVRPEVRPILEKQNLLKKFQWRRMELGSSEQSKPERLTSQ